MSTLWNNDHNNIELFFKLLRSTFAHFSFQFEDKMNINGTAFGLPAVVGIAGGVVIPDLQIGWYASIGSPSRIIQVQLYGTRSTTSHLSRLYLACVLFRVLAG